LSPRSRGDVPHRRHEGEDDQEEEAVGEKHDAQGIEEEGAVHGHDGQEGDQRGVGKGKNPPVEEQRDGGKEDDRRQPHQEFIRSEQFVKGPVDPAHQGGVIHVTPVQEIGVEKIMGLIDTQAEGGGHQQAQEGHAAQKEQGQAVPVHLHGRKPLDARGRRPCSSLLIPGSLSAARLSAIVNP